MALRAAAMALLAATTVASGAEAATYYVRVDGGSAAQCDGRRDAAYPGSGAHQPCAWRHPFDALPPGGPARIAGGDTLLIGAGSYRMGAGAPGADALEKCRSDWPWDCHLPPLPSGPTPQQPTRVAGAGYDRGCTNAPQLWGADHASTVVDLEGSSNVELACLEITDHSACIEFHSPADRRRCERDAPPYGDWASSGISAADSASVRLDDVDIHGLAHDGIRAGRVRDWTLAHVQVNGNGWAGWNGDVGADSADAGQLVFRDVEIAWNGCGESYPGRAHDACWGQEEGGYGDGLGTGATGGDWLFDHVDVHDNTQDGIDLLHATAGATITFRNVHAAGNAGNQLKATGAITLEDSTVVGNCGSLSAGHGLGAADACRARGNSILLRLPGDTHSTIRGDTISGEGDCLIGLECAGERCAAAAALVDANHLVGSLRAGDPQARLPCALWVDPALNGARVQFSRNDVRSTRNPGCPQGVSGCGDEQP